MKIIAGFLVVISAINWYIQTNYGLTDAQKSEAKKMKFCIIGAGVSGICVGYFFKLMNLDFEIIEKGAKPGGTWFWNTYPGIGCDVQSHAYSFSFYLNSEWTKVFSLGDEIENYLIKAWSFARLTNNTRFNTEITKAFWNEETSKWELTAKENRKESVVECNWLISCIGGLHKPMIPEFKGQKNFPREIMAYC